LFTAQEDFRDVLVDGFLGITSTGDVLDDDFVVGMFTLLEQSGVGGKDIISAGLLGGFLGLEGLFSAEVLTVVVTEMVITDDGDGLEATTNNNVDEGSLKLGLTSLEVITNNESVVSDSQFDDTINQGVLRATVDEGDTFEGAGSGIDDRGRDFGVAIFDGLQEVVSSVVDTDLNLAVSFSVTGPHDDDFVELVGFLELSEVSSDSFEVLFLVVTGDDVISSFFLVGGNEVFIVDSGKGDDVLHVGFKLDLEIVFQDFSSSHGISQVHLADIPTTDDDIVGVNEGEDLVQGKEDFGVLGVTDLSGRGLGDGAQIVGLVGTGSGVPGDVVLVGKDTSGEGGTVVTTETNEHSTKSRGLGSSLEGVLGLLKVGGVDTVAFSHDGSLADVGGGDILFSVLGVRADDSEVV
jgi:hypothetical protein